MNKRHTGKLLAFLLAVVFIFSLVPQVMADNGGSLSLTRNLLEEPIYFIINDNSGETYFEIDGLVPEINDNDEVVYSPVSTGASFSFRFAFLFQDDDDQTNQIILDDGVELQLDDKFMKIVDLGGRGGMIQGVHEDENGVSTDFDLANWFVSTDGKLTIKFTEDALDKNVTDFYFAASGSLRLDETAEEEGYEFELVAGGEVYRVIFEEDQGTGPDPAKDASIEKTGSFNPESETITWTLKVAAGSEDALEGAYIKEIIGDNQNFEEAFYYLGQEKKSLASQDDGTGAYTIDLPRIEANSELTVYVVTKVTNTIYGTNESAIETWSNRVELFPQEGDKFLDYDEGSASHEMIWAKKEENDSYEITDENGVRTHYIEWMITLNPDELGIIPKNSYLEDSIPPNDDTYKYQDYFKLDDEFTFVINPDNLNLTGGYITETDGTKKFVLTFNEDVDQIVTVTIRTIIDEEFFKKVNSSQKFLNKATLFVPITGEGEGEGGNGDQQFRSYDYTGEGDVFSSILKKKGIAYDAATQLITWRLKINENGLEIENAVVTDIIPSVLDGVPHLDFVHGSVYFSNADGVAEENGAIVSGEEGDTAPYYSYDTANEKLKILLGTIGDLKYITFQTKVLNPQHFATNSETNYTNNVTLTGKADDIDINVTVTGNQVVNSTVIAKEGAGYKRVEIASDGDDSWAGEITWKITINQNKMLLTNAVVTDLIPDDQEYVNGSMEIRKGDGGNAIWKESGTPQEPGITLDKNSNNEFTLTFTSIDDEHTISFKTYLTQKGLNRFLDENDTVTFKNSATLEPGYDSVSITVIGEQDVKNKSVSKLGSFDKVNRVFHWVVLVNTNGAPLSEAKLSDELQTGLSLDVETVKLYRGDLDPDNGDQLIRGDEILVDSDHGETGFSFDLTFDEGSDRQSGGLFEISLPNVTASDPHGFILEFDTEVMQGGVTYSNSISFSGAGNASSGTTGGTWISREDFSSGGTGRSGKIVVMKTGEEGALSGAVFELRNINKNQVVATGITDDYGIIEFAKLVPGRTYHLREIEAPRGYGISEEAASFFEIELTTEEPLFTKAYSNRLLRADISINKFGPSDERLNGGLFGIRYPGGKETILLPVKAIDGVITFEQLLPGTYEIYEIEPPHGYSINEVRSVVTVTLELSEDNQLHEIDAEDNDPIVNDYDGKITIKKRGASGALKDVTFELLQTLEGSTDPTYVVIDTKTTDVDGIIEFTGLPLGTYYVRETAAPSGYHLNTTLHEVVLTADSETGDNDETINGWEQTLELRNYLLTDSVILTKTDPNGVALDGGWFGIFSNAEATGDPLDKVQADGGQIVFSGLLHGTYYVRELEAPAGYIKSDKIIKVGVSVSGNSIAGEVVKEPLVNTWAGGIKLVKVDEKGEPLAGAVFELLDANKKVIKEGTSGKDGVIEFKELAMGTYYLREKTAPAGYAKLMELTEVVLKAGAEADMVKTVKLANHRNLASVTLRKTNQYDGQLSGGLFGIYKTDDTGFKNPLQKVASVKGIITFTDLEAGQYFIREIEAPKHHKRTDEFVKVVLEVNPDTGLLEDLEIEEPLLNETPLTEEEWDEIVEGDEEEKDNGEKDDDLVETGGFLDTAMLWFFGTLLILAGAILLLRMRAALVRK